MAAATGCFDLAASKEALPCGNRDSSPPASRSTLCACAAPPPRPAFDTQPVASGPKAVPQRNLTHFTDGLRCMDDMLHRFGVRDVSVMIEDMQDQSRRLGAGTRDMMVSAFADMTRRSRGVRLVTFGQDNQNIVQLLSLAQRSMNSRWCRSTTSAARSPSSTRT